MQHVKKGFRFSLVELMVVIAILGILASLLQPSLVQMLSGAQRLGCSENLRHIGASYFIYAEDNDDDVADNLFIGSIASRVYYYNKTRGNYRAAQFGGRFYNGQAGYLEPYIGDNDSSYVCPGSEFAQGVKAFGTRNQFTSRTATYTSFSPYNFQLRKLKDRYIINPSTDEQRGWDQKTIKPVFLDPIRNMSAWYRNSIGQGVAWDQYGMVIHQNRNELPILMSDGHVFMYDRVTYPTRFISETGFTNYFLMIDQIMDNF